MGDKTAISWTDATWNPIAGCSLVSPGCTNCYAMREAHRLGNALEQEKYRGLTMIVNERPVWNGDVRLWPAALDQPLRWKAPRRIFVNSMSDLFHEGLSNEEIAVVFGIMGAARQHTFQVLTKRPERMRQWFEWVSTQTDHVVGGHRHPREVCGDLALGTDAISLPHYFAVGNEVEIGAYLTWPLPNVWLGVSAEDQPRADERIPLLLQAPAAVRFVSYEPALAEVDFRRWLRRKIQSGYDQVVKRLPAMPHAVPAHLSRPTDGLDWVIVGGESGSHARPFEIRWARSVVSQCRTGGVACFVKQLGARLLDDAHNHNDWPSGTRAHVGTTMEAPRWIQFVHRAGADPSEWPEDLRVQEFPS